MTEGILKRIVQHGGTNVEKGLHRRPVPAHLLLLVHALGHDFVDCTLDECRQDRLTPSTPGSIMHQHVLIALKVTEEFPDVSLKTIDVGDRAYPPPPTPPESGAGKRRSKSGRSGLVRFTSVIAQQTDRS